jgi:hypothetical protein
MATQPNNPPTNPVPGAIYVENTTGVTWIWTGVAWLQAGGSDGYNLQVKYGMAITPGFYTGLSGKGGADNLSAIATQYGTTPPTSPGFGQVWVDTTNPTSPVTNVWTAPGQWTKTSDGVNNTYVSSDAPASPDLGDTWYETDTTSFYVWDGALWRPISGGGTGASGATGFISYASAPVAGPEGAVYYNSTEDKLYVSNGAAWEEVLFSPDTDTNSITALTAPTVRADGSALQAGDLWVNTTDYELNYYDSGSSSWVRISSADAGNTHSFYQSSAPTQRSDGTALGAGDLWINSANNVSYVWTSSMWSPVAVPNETNTNSIVSTVAPATRPGGSSLVSGDIWVNSISNTSFYWNGSSWTLLTSVGTDTHSIISGGAPIQRPDSTALRVGDLWTNPTTLTLSYYDGANWFTLASSTDTQSIYQASQPNLRPNGDPLQVGDMWVNSGSDSLYVYSGTSFVPLVSATDSHSFVAANPPGLRQDGSVLQTGDMWVDSDNNNVYYRTAAGTWQLLAGGSDTHSFVAAAPPATRPDTSSLVTGDQWVNTSTDALSYWDGASWAPVVTTSSPLTVADGTATTTHSPAAGQMLVVDSSTSTNTVTLPSSPAANASVAVVDGTNNAFSNNITINSGGGELFQSQAGPYVIATDSGVVRFTYSGIASVGWIVERAMV